VPPRNFDTDPDSKRGARLAQDFAFTIGGESLELRHGVAIGSTALDRWSDVLDRFLADEDEKAKPEWRKVEDDEFLETFRDTMFSILVPGSQAAFERVLANETDPLMIPDAVELLIWAVQVVTGGRPTEASSPSSDGSTAPTPEPDAASSTDASSSPATPTGSPD
jgi:hypothetical protein